MGGDFNLRYRKDEIKKTTYNISPAIGHFVADKFAIGARADFNNYAFRLTNAIGPFFRYYFLTKDQKVNLFGDAAYIYSWAGTFKSNGYNIKAGPAIFISPSVALEFTVGYFHSREVNSNYKTSEMRTAIGFQIHLGSAKQVTRNNSGR